MKKTLLPILVLTLLLTMAACGAQETELPPGFGSFTNASVAGPWGFFISGETPTYLDFDGMGGITNTGMINPPAPMSYSVQNTGEADITLGAITYSGGLTSYTDINIISPIPGSAVEVSSPGMCAGVWVGQLIESYPPNLTHTVTVTVDPTGTVTGFLDDQLTFSTFSGRIYCIGYSVVGIIRNDSIGANHAIQIDGDLSSVGGILMITGEFHNDATPLDGGSINLARF